MERIQEARWGLYGALAFFGALALRNCFQPLLACSFGVASLGLYVSSLLFHKPPPYLILSIDGGGIQAA